jgi:hypothetical protein
VPDVEGSKPKKKFKAYPIGYFHIDIAELWTKEGKLYMFVAIYRTSKFAVAELHEHENTNTGGLEKVRSRAVFGPDTSNGIPDHRRNVGDDQND